MKELDQQFHQWKDKLISEVKIPQDDCIKIATTIEYEIKNLGDNHIKRLEEGSPIDLRLRIEELSAFQSMMDIFNKMKPKPEIVRTQVITQNYICFVYLKDTLFEQLKRLSPNESVTKKMLQILIE